MEGDDKVLLGLSPQAAQHLADMCVTGEEEHEWVGATPPECILCIEIGAEVSEALQAAREA